jgi:hypothetical protein
MLVECCLGRTTDKRLVGTVHDRRAADVAHVVCCRERRGAVHSARTRPCGRSLVIL